MRSTEIIRTVCDMARNRRASPELVEDAIGRLLSDIDPERRVQLRREIDNAVAAVKRELEKEARGGPGGALTREP